MRGKWLIADVNPTKANLYYFEHKFNAEKGATTICNGYGNRGNVLVVYVLGYKAHKESNN